LAAYAITEREGEDEEEEEMKEEREMMIMKKMIMKKKNSGEMWRQRWRRLKDNCDRAAAL
jgi:hypothetical protein